MKENNAIYFFIGAHYGKELLILALIAIGLFGIFGTILMVWIYLPK